MNLNDGYMKNLSRLSAPSNPGWFKNWFDSSFYHQLYAHRSEKEAAHFIDNLIPILQPKEDAKMLDLGCGAGRHSKHLATKGFHVTGLDLAKSSIQQASRFERPNLQFFQHDMRIPFGKNYFDFAFSFFTSFGYFDSDAENRQVINNIAQSLKPGGVVMMDYLNANYASKGLMGNETKEIDGIVYHITRWMDNQHFYKKIAIELQSGKPFEYSERVAKLHISDFESMFSDHGLKLLDIYGDYEMNEFVLSSSPRLIMIAEKG
jgi:SAM-dependent methyltransferase